MNIDIEVLNACVDDWEALDEILLPIRFEACSEVATDASSSLFHWRERHPGITLREIAQAIHHLVRSGELLAKREDGTHPVSLSAEDLFECWFHASDTGKLRLVNYSTRNSLSS